MVGCPERQLVYEIPLQPFVSHEALQRITNTETIVDHLFEMHSAVITPRVIARRQVSRLVERVVSKVQGEGNTENTSQVKNTEPENKLIEKRMVSNVLSSVPAKPD